MSYDAGPYGLLPHSCSDFQFSVMSPRKNKVLYAVTFSVMTEHFVEFGTTVMFFFFKEPFYEQFGHKYKRACI